MIEDAWDCCAVLNDTIRDYPELEDLQLTPSKWKQLYDIRTMLKPFGDYTEYVSQHQPSVHMVTSLYLKLESTLKGITQRQGEYTQFDIDIVNAVKKGLVKFNKYYKYIQGNDIYYIVAILDL